MGKVMKGTHVSLRFLTYTMWNPGRMAVCGRADLLGAWAPFHWTTFRPLGHQPEDQLIGEGAWGGPWMCVGDGSLSLMTWGDGRRACSETL